MMGRIEDAEQRRGTTTDVVSGTDSHRQEMNAIEQCMQALDGLELCAQRRVWNWVRDKYGLGR